MRPRRKVTMVSKEQRTGNFQGISYLCCAPEWSRGSPSTASLSAPNGGISWFDSHPASMALLRETEHGSESTSFFSSSSQCLLAACPRCNSQAVIRFCECVEPTNSCWLWGRHLPKCLRKNKYRFLSGMVRFELVKRNPTCCSFAYNTLRHVILVRYKLHQRKRYRIIAYEQRYDRSNSFTNKISFQTWLERILCLKAVLVAFWLSF